LVPRFDLYTGPRGITKFGSINLWEFKYDEYKYKYRAFFDPWKKNNPSHGILINNATIIINQYLINNPVADGSSEIFERNELVRIYEWLKKNRKFNKRKK